MIDSTELPANHVVGILAEGSLVNSVVESVGQRGASTPEVASAVRGGDRATRAQRRHSLLDEGPFAGSRILVVDDDSHNIFAMSVLLKRGHGDVATATSGAEALTILQRTPDIHLVLMDIMMKGMDGYATMRAIREQEQFRALPILAVTALVVPGERERCIDAGANDYVPKPVNTAELVAAIWPWLRPRPSDMTAPPQ